MAKQEKVLYLLRHAGGQRFQTSMMDFDRPLSERGKKRLIVLCDHLKKHPIAPEVIFCSKAKRARQTCAYLKPYFPNARIVYHDYLYLASEYSLLELLNLVDDSICHILILGHETSLTNLVYLLLKKENSLSPQSLHVTPCTLIRLRLKDDTRWVGFNYKQAVLDEIFSP